MNKLDLSTVSPLRAWVIVLMANFGLSHYDALVLAIELQGKVGERFETVSFEGEQNVQNLLY